MPIKTDQNKSVKITLIISVDKKWQIIIKPNFLFQLPSQFSDMNHSVVCAKFQHFPPPQSSRSPKLLKEQDPLNSGAFKTSSRLFSQAQLFDALRQIHQKLQFDLHLEFQKNKILTKLAEAAANTNVKVEQDDITPIKLEKQPQQQNSTKQLKKQTNNDTKNISKNFGKAIIAYVLKNSQKFDCVLKKYQINSILFKEELRQRKKKLISIKQLRSLWLQEEFQYARAFRQISAEFLRKGSFKYIFGSRINDYTGHLKYRARMLQALENPGQFTSIKQ